MSYPIQFDYHPGRNYPGAGADAVAEFTKDLVENYSIELISKWYSAVEKALLDSGLPMRQIQQECKSKIYDESLSPCVFSDETVILREVFLGEVKIARMIRTGFKFHIETGNLD